MLIVYYLFVKLYDHHVGYMSYNYDLDYMLDSYIGVVVTVDCLDGMKVYFSIDYYLIETKMAWIQIDLQTLLMLPIYYRQWKYFQFYSLYCNMHII